MQNYSFLQPCPAEQPYFHHLYPPLPIRLIPYFRSRMHAVTKAIRLIFSVYGFIVFLILMFLLFPAVVFASFFGRVRGGNMIYAICAFWARAAFFFYGIRWHNIYMEPVKGDHPVVYVINHISYLDIPMWLLALRKSHIRVLGKSEMAKIPVFGFIYKEAVILVDRSSAAHRRKSIMELKYFLNRNISVVIAPEGTFNMTNQPLKEFYDGAFRIAIQTQTPIRPVVFPDTHSRLNRHSIFTLNPGICRAVFLPEVPVSGYSIDDVAKLREAVYIMMEDALITYKAGWIKND